LALFLCFCAGLLWAIAVPNWQEHWNRATVYELDIGLLAVVLATVITLT